MGRKNLKITVIGRVQGVFFRASTSQKAQALGITGFVKNQSDGSVLIGAEGEESMLKELEDWCLKGGPSGAKVTEVQTIEEELKGWGSFSIKR